MEVKSVFLFWGLVFHCLLGYAWNAAGHQLVAQIAYDNLSPQAKERCAKILNVNENDLELSFIAASTWLDEIRGRKIYQFDLVHYIDIPFTKDHTPLPKIKKMNAVWAIKQALLVLSSNTVKNSIKLLNLKLLIHVVGDIHQPLHTATKVSRRLPKGDLGGNLYLFSRSAYGKNLHQYWDNGAGLLIKKPSLEDIKQMAQQWEESIPCVVAQDQKEPEQWVESSHSLALTQVYSLRTHTKPSMNYQYSARETAVKQIVLAGCRLADALNKM